jgi:hypothetical protein
LKNCFVSRLAYTTMAATGRLLANCARVALGFWTISSKQLDVEA